MPYSNRLLLAVAVALLTGCSAVKNFSVMPYRMNVQQGNYLEAEDVDRLEVGMTQSQVRFLLGTPMVADPFKTDRWDYVFFFKIGRTREEIMNHLTVWFEDERVVRIDRPEDLDEGSRPETAGFDS